MTRIASSVFFSHHSNVIQEELSIAAEVPAGDSIIVEKRIGGGRDNGNDFAR